MSSDHVAPGDASPVDSNFVSPPASTDGLLEVPDTPKSGASSPVPPSRKARGPLSAEDQAKKDKAQRIDRIHDKL
jgi:hypothetical protein